MPCDENEEADEEEVEDEGVAAAPCAGAGVSYLETLRLESILLGAKRSNKPLCC